jgi:hypothetical protein
MKPAFLGGYMLEVTLLHRFARTASSLWWCVPELLASKEVTLVDGKVRFLTDGESLPLVVSSATPGWLILSALRGGVPELLAPC